MIKSEKKTIAVVTGTRAEYGIVKPLLKSIKKTSGLKLELLITGLHLMKKYGLTIREIERDGFETDNRIPMYGKNEAVGSYYGEALGKGVTNFTKQLMKIKPDMLVVTGDRLEPLAATLAAANLRIPVVHIHGGEKTNSGCIDESIRHAITRFAHIHLVSTEESKKRILKMGEEPWRVFRVGALGQESILNSTQVTKSALFKKYRLDPKQKLILCIFNPVIFEANSMRRHMREILNALKKLKIQSIVIYPNNDTGFKGIIKEIDKCRKIKFIKVHKNLIHDDYINLMKKADVLIGNSSSGIIEAPSIKLPVVNIGLRNTGREHGDNIIFVDPRKEDIVKAIRKVLFNKEFREKLRKCKNPYKDARTIEKIINILREVKLDKTLLFKYLTY